MYLTPDLTGVNELYKVTNDIRMVVAAEQKINFPFTVFADSITVTLLGTINTTLLKGADWTVTSSDLDYEAMGAMKLKSSEFSATLVKSITIIKPYVADYKINLGYQQLYPVHSKIALYPDQQVLQFTPDLLRYMLELLQRHENLLAPVKDVHSAVNQNPILLELDTHKQRPENFISEEVHQVNVPSGIHTIHPIGGAYFKDSLVVINANNDNTLIENDDYVVYGLDHHKTAQTSNTSGVYKYVLFLKPFVGSVKISYHAFGGDPTIEDIRALDETDNNILQYLADAQLLTAETVSGAPALVLIRQKLTELEASMRSLASTGRPSYGDVTHGGCLTKRIAAIDTDLHWWTIAALYQVDGSSEVFLSDTMKIRIQTLQTKFAFDAIVNVNLLHPTNKMDVKCLSATYPKGYIPFTDYTEMENIIRPQFRIIWNENVTQGSGILLQIGLRLKTVAEETIAVEDWSGAQSCWRLINSPTEAILPEDTILTLPNTDHVWDLLNPDSRQVTQLIPFPDGHIVWAGSEALNRPDSGWKNFELVHNLEKEIDYTKINRIRVDLEEQGSSKFPVSIEVIPGLDELVGSTSFNYNGKPAYINAIVSRNPVTEEIKISVNAEIVAGPTSNALNLRQVLIFL